MPEVTKVFTCVVCSKRFDSRQAVAGHLRWHDQAEYCRTSFSAKKSDWLEFKRICDKHGTTTCSMLRSYLEVVIAGEKQGIVTVGSQNPITIQLNHVVLGASRGRYSHVDLDRALACVTKGEFAGKELTDALRCGFLNHRADVSGRIGFCRGFKRWVTPEICVGCVKK